MLEERKWSAVQPAISDKNKRRLVNGSALRSNKQLRRLSHRDLRCGDKIAQRAEAAFESLTSFLDHLRIEPHAGELDKESSICARKIDKTHVVALNNVPAEREIARRQTKFHRKDIYCADRQQTYRDAAPRDAIDHLIDCSIAAGRNNLFNSLLRSAPGQRLCFGTMRRN